MIKKLLFSFLFLFSAYSAHSQILISIIFGDKLNSEGLEFGLDGGINFSSISGLESKSMATDLHLGFYFDIKLSNQLWLNTGVLVKSSQGATKLSENDVHILYPELDSFNAVGDFSQSMGYFNVPIMLKYRFRNHLYGELGTQISFLTKARLNYYHEYDDVEITTSVDNRAELNRLDIGILGGFGFKLKKGKGMNIGFKYYYGLMDMTKSSALKNYNQVIYIKVDIPIGKEKVDN